MKWQGTTGTTVLASTIRQYILKQFSDGPSNDALTLKLCTSTSPSLNLIDLPGLRSAHPSYSLALNVDSAKAIQVAKELDPSCSRIVGVISKIDKAASEPRVLAAVEALLLNEGHGFASGIPRVAVGEPVHCPYRMGWSS
ncbi:hypothetical protein ACP275_03G123800 [Erythranthe tilingii]